MKRKAVSGIVLMLLLTSMLSSAFNVQPVKASETIYIRNDGSIDPSTAPIQRVGDVYTFTENIYESIVIERENIIVDGNGYTLQGSGIGYGVKLLRINNVTVRRVNIKAFYTGIFLGLSNNTSIIQNKLENNTWGIQLWESSNNNVSLNEVVNDHYYGIHISYMSSYNLLNLNNVTANLYGIVVGQAPYNTFKGNRMSENQYNFNIHGTPLSDYIQDIDASNTVDGKSVYYLVNQQNAEIPSDAGYVALVNCSRIVVRNLTLAKNADGILVLYTESSSITQNNITGNGVGIRLIESSKNTINLNKMTENDFGITLFESSNNTISRNTITGKNVANVEQDGIIISQSSNNNIILNNIISNGVGLWLDGSGDNGIILNNVVNNQVDGIFLSTSSNNTIYHNNFMNNTNQVNSYVSINTWDDGYPSGGNFWSNYAGVDEFSGPNQDQLGSDGIGDAPFIIDDDNQDRYPFMNPWTPTPDFLITASPTSLTIQQDGSDTSVITITSIGGFDQPVQLAISGAPSGVTAALNPEQVTPPPNGSTTSTLTVSVSTTATLGSYTLTVTGTSDTLTHSVDISLEITVPPTSEWSFAIITDLHIGRGYPDYGGEGIGVEDMQVAGQDYYLTERLNNTVRWVNDYKNEYNIRFVVVLGDISDSGEYSELRKAKDILDKLDVPYIPVIGNHDIWPYTKDEEDQNERYFEYVFAEQFVKLTEDASFNLHKQPNPDPYDLQNYAFSYNGITFIALDWGSREAALLGGGVDHKAFLHEDTVEWLNTSLLEGKPTIIFSHHLMSHVEKYGFDVSFEDDDLRDLEMKINEREWGRVLANFAGHIHGYYDEYHIVGFSPPINPHFMDANVDYREEGYITPAGIPVVTTEAVMVASNEPTPKGVIRIGKVKGEEIDYNTIEGEFRALNPYFKEIDMWEWRPPWRFVVEFEVYAFTKRFTEERPGVYTIDFGDGTPSESKESKRWDEAVQFDHDYKRGEYYDVTLTVTGWTPGGERIEEEITRRIYVPTLLSIGARSPVDIAVTDPEGRMINRQLNEIPGAEYVEVDLNEDGDLEDLVLIPDPLDGNYMVLLIGTATGTYSLNTELIALQETTFVAVDIPTSANAIHQYTIDWSALSQGEEGVTVKVDSDGDGVFELTFTSDNELARGEFMSQVSPAEAFPMWIVGVAIAAVTIATVTGAVFWRRRKQPPTKE